MTTGTTRLHIDLSHYPFFYRSSKFPSNKNNNNVGNSLAHKTSENLLINCKQKSLIQVQSQSDSEFENVPKPPRSLTLPAGQRKRSITLNPLPHNVITHPYFCDGLALRRRPCKLLTNGINQLLSNNSRSCLKSCIQDEELPEISIADRKKLLMKSIPRFHRSITPSESFVSGKKCDLLNESMHTNTDNNVGEIQIRNEVYQSAEVMPTILDENSEHERDATRKRSTSGEEVKIVHTRQKLSLTRRCSEATLPLTFSLKKHLRHKFIKKPRSKTNDLILDQDNKYSIYPLENQEISNSQNIVDSKSISPTKRMFINSRSAMPRHSVYFLPLSLDFNDEETDSFSQLFRTEDNEFSVESSQNYLSDKTSPLRPCHITSNSILTDTSLTEDSYYGEDVRMNQLINSGDTLSPNRDSNFDNNQSENYSNTLDSQDGINMSSSIEDIICRGGDLGDSGCHFDQLTNKYFSTPPVKKVILDLSQMKYVGLSLVGGSDSPFGNLPVLVKEIMPGGAAERCEIRRGDEIIGINSFSLEDKPLQFAVERLRHCSSRDQEIILWVIEITD